MERENLMSHTSEGLLEIYNEISISQVKSDVAFRTLVECVNENMYVIPEYQRKFRWSKQKIENLAVSLIKGLPIPPIYTYRNDDNQLEILDGQQRVISLFLYYFGKIVGNERSPFFDYQNMELGDGTFYEALERTQKIKDCIYVMSVDDCEYDISYRNLPKKLQRKVDYAPITVIEIKIESEKNRDKILHRIFANLNREGEKLSDQELRNGIYPCKFYHMLDEMNKKNAGWRKIYGGLDRKGKDMEILLRLCAMKYYVSFSKSKKKFLVRKYDNALLDDFSEFAIGFGEKECLEYKRSLERFFTRFEITKKCKKVTVLDSLFMVTEKAGVDIVITNEMCSELESIEDFKTASRQGTMSASNMKKRWNIAYEQLSRYDKEYSG